MKRSHYERARRIRDSNVALVAVFLVTAVALAPTVSLVSDRPLVTSELLLSATWWTSAGVLAGYGLVHVLAAVADTRRFLDDHGTDYAGEATVFCHALGQRLFVLVGVGFALVLLAIAGPGVGAPFAVPFALGLFGATLLGPPVAIPMNRRVSDRLAEYRDR